MTALVDATAGMIRLTTPDNKEETFTTIIVAVYTVNITNKDSKSSLLSSNKGQHYIKAIQRSNKNKYA